MACINSEFVLDNSRRNDNQNFKNWIGNVNINVESFFEPITREDLVWIVREAGIQRKKLKVVGSRWSFEDIAASTEWMVSINSLSNFIENIVNTSDDDNALNDTVRGEISAGRAKLIHVEAGIRLFELNTNLHSRGLAMITLGGSQGQTLAGAISTSTHGGDIDLPPFPDLIKAIHLVTNEGQEIWVESSSDSITQDDRLFPRLNCAEAQIIRDDELFKALQVSVGRFGVIYSYVIQVREAFDLVEHSVERNWPDIRALLVSGIGTDAPLQPLIDSLSDSMPSGVEIIDSRPRYLEILSNSRNVSNIVWVKRRWEIVHQVPTIGIPDFDFFGCGTGLLNSYAYWVSVSIHFLKFTYSWYPVWGAYKSIQIAMKEYELRALSLDPNLTANQFVTTLINAIWEIDEFNLCGNSINNISKMIVDREISDKNGKFGPSWNLMAGTGPGGDPCQLANSIEVIFSNNSENYLQFLDFLYSQGPNFKQSGYISARISRPSQALLSMHNVEGAQAISIEIASLKGFAQNREWMHAIEARAIELGGRPHWGQHNNLTMFQVETLYNDKLNRWKEQLNRIVGGTNTFSNHYTQQRGLEPSNLIRPVTSVRRNEGRITHLCNPDAHWSPITVENAILLINNRTTFITRPADLTIPSANIIVRRFLTTPPDGTILNNLSALPSLMSPLTGLPQWGNRNRHVTHVVRNTFGNINYLCNLSENWCVHENMAMLEIQANMTDLRIEYYIQHIDAEDRTVIIVRELLSTPIDFIPENNLSALPECP